MPHNKRILLAVDESDASRRAVDYVADMIDGRAGFHIGLVHLESPPRMLEWGGSENPEIEEKVSAQRGQTYRQLEKKAIAEGKVMLQQFKATLEQKGIEVVVLLVRFEEPLDRKRIANEILTTAQEQHYGTIVVGRHMFSLLESFFKHHVGEQLVRAGERVAVWVVE